LRIALSIAVGFVAFILCVFYGLNLLESKQLSGGEFVALIVSFAVIGLIISFSSEIQEFSVAGNIVKLKEVKKDAEKSIKELKEARTETFRFLLSLAKRYPGGWGNGGTVDSRLSDFWFLYDQIIKFGCKNDLKENISDVVEELIRGQLSSISGNSDNVAEKYREKSVVPSPSELTIEALDNNSVEKTAERNVCDGSIEKIKTSLVVGLDEYKKLYELREELNDKI
jgi:hypothetical protein